MSCLAFFSGYGDAYDGGGCRDHAAKPHIYEDFLIIYTVFMMNYVFSAFVRNDNAPTLAMIGTMMGSFSNVVLDYVFMFPMGMGLAGAALATAASPIVSILICSIHFFRRKIRYSLQRPDHRYGCLQHPASWGAGICGRIFFRSDNNAFNYLILGLAGNVGVAAYGVIANFALIFTCIFNGISQEPSHWSAVITEKGMNVRLKDSASGTGYGRCFQSFDYFACLGIYRPDGSLV